MAVKSRWFSRIRLFILVVLAAYALLILYSFPYHTDPQTERTAKTVEAAQKFYDAAWNATPKPKTKQQQEQELKYIEGARGAAGYWKIEDIAKAFVKKYGLEHKKVLDVGAGRGYLQDVVDDYTGLDISASSRQYFHKRFVLGSATNMPFRDGEFDAIWSIWVMEHVPNPEAMLREMRRVLKPGGVILFFPAWSTVPWAADGYAVRPYSDFGPGGKLIKFSLLWRSTEWFKELYSVPIRAIRGASAAVIGGPTAFHYHPLVPNYDIYWTADSDGVNSMDAYEGVLWFRSRGDRCLNCPGGLKDLTQMPWIVVLQVKPDKSNLAPTWNLKGMTPGAAPSF